MGEVLRVQSPMSRPQLGLWMPYRNWGRFDLPNPARYILGASDGLKEADNFDRCDVVLFILSL